MALSTTSTDTLDLLLLLKQCPASLVIVRFKDRFRITLQRAGGRTLRFWAVPEACVRETRLPFLPVGRLDIVISCGK